ncbi:MAG: N-acetylmuramoyl-L-alanine amidase [Sphingomonadaceae bacterium]
MLAWAAFVMIATLAAAPGQAAAVRGIDFGTDEIVLRFDGIVRSASAFVVDGPNRLAIDLDDADVGSGGVPTGLFTAVRHGQFDKKTARVVIELAKPMVVTGGHLSQDGRALVVSVAPATNSGFATAVRTGRRVFASPLARGTFAPPSRGLTVPIGRPSKAKSIKLPAVQGGRSADRPLVVIDAGHGGHDPGAPTVLGESRSEKDVTLAIARALRDELLASGRVRVAMTREDDRFLVLGERREIARRLKADLFISIHADSAENKEARGASVYTLSEVASDKVAAQLAIKENRADVLNGVDLGSEASDVSSILIDLTQRETMNISSAFAGLLQREMAENVLTRTNYHRFANLMVLKAPDVPSVLIETGYMSNLDDARFLFSRDGQKRIAVAVRRAIEAHFARRLAQR